jgi:hypothetical protein
LTSREPLAPEVLHHLPEIGYWIAKERALGHAVIHMAVVGERGNVVVMWCVIEPNNRSLRLPMIGVLLPTEPDIEEAVVNQEKPEVTRCIAGSPLDDGVSDERRKFRTGDGSERLVRR